MDLKALHEYIVLDEELVLYDRWVTDCARCICIVRLGNVCEIVGEIETNY